MQFTTVVPVVLMLACVIMHSAVGTRNLCTNDVHVQVGDRHPIPHSTTMNASTCEVFDDRSYYAGVPVTQIGHGATSNTVSCREIGSSNTDTCHLLGRAVKACVAAAASPADGRSGVLLFIVLRSVLLVLMLLLSLDGWLFSVTPTPTHPRLGHGVKQYNETSVLRKNKLIPFFENRCHGIHRRVTARSSYTFDRVGARGGKFSRLR